MGECCLNIHSVRFHSAIDVVLNPAEGQIACRVGTAMIITAANPDLTTSRGVWDARGGGD
jgi:hypothetical protein